MPKRTYIYLILLMVFGSCVKDQRALVVGKIQSASKMVSTEFTIDKIVHGSKTKKIAWKIVLGEARFLANSQAKIKTGINLNKLKAENIKIEGKRIELVLPPVEIINFSYPPSSFKLDDQITDVNAFLTKIDIEDQEVFFRQAELDIRNNLQYMGLVETTQQQTRNMLVVLLKSLDYQEIYISFESNELIIDKVNIVEEK